MKIDLRIEEIKFQAPWLEDDATLTPELLIESDINATLSKPKAKAAPMGTRRRMTPVSKMVIDSTLNEALQLDDISYAVFSSRHGENTQKATLAENVLYTQPISPTIFSQSVHNTSAGLYSIFKKCRKPTTTIAAGKQTLSAALLEAYVFIKENPGSKVLVVAFDEQLAPEMNLDQYCGEQSATFSLAMIVSDGEANLSVQLNNDAEANNFVQPETIQFLSWWIAESKDELVTPGQVNTVRWQNAA